MAERMKEFSYRGASFRLKAEYDDEAPSDRGTHTATEVDETLLLIQSAWEKYIDVGYNFGVDQAGTRVYEVQIGLEPGKSPEATNTILVLGLDNLRASKDLSRSSAQRARSLALFKGMIAHELFHACTFDADPFLMGMPSFIEGAANVGQYLLASDDDRALIGFPSYDAYLNNTQIPMFDQASPGEPDSSRSVPTILWMYLVERFAEHPDDFQSYFAVMRDLLDWDGPKDLSLVVNRSDRLAAGKFLGNGQSQLVVYTDQPASRLGLVSPSLSFGGTGQVHSVVADNERFERDGWRVRSGDRCVGIGDLLGNRRDQFVVQSENPMYLGVLGYDQTDGRWGEAHQRSYTACPVGERWGGWKLRDGDHVHAIGRVVDSDRAHMIVISQPGAQSAHIGILGVVADDSRFERETVVAARDGSRLGDSQGWEFRSTDKVVGTGRLSEGRGTEQFLIQRGDGSAIGVIAVDDNQFRTRAIVETNERFGNGWRVKAGDEILAVGAFGPGGTSSLDRIVLRSVEGNLGVVGFDERGNSLTYSVHGRGGSIEGTDSVEERAWQWSQDTVVEGHGYFLPTKPDHEQLFVRRPVPDPDDRGPFQQMALLSCDGSGELAASDNTEEDPRAESLSEVWAIGAFSLGESDTAYGPNANGGYWRKTTRMDDARLIDDGTELGRWRETGPAVEVEGGRYTSVLYQLEKFIQSREPSTTFVQFWRDFTLSNLGKDLEGAPAKWSYPVALSDPAKTILTPPRDGSRDGRLGTTTIKLNRWAATYIHLPVSTQNIVARVLSGPHRVFWSVLVYGPDDSYRRYILDDDNECDMNVALERDERAVLILTTTFADVSVSLTLR